MSVIPHLFRCPITLDLFKDPVTLSTGQTYERCSIEKWLNAGNHTCPVTMQQLYDLSIVPNHTLRRLIDQWLQLDRQLSQENIDPHSLALLKQCLESNESQLDEKTLVLERIWSLCNEFPSTISSFVELGFMQLLLKLLFEKTESGFSRERVKVYEEALSCVVKLLPFVESGSINILKEEQSLLSMNSLFKHGNAKIKTCLCQLIEAISVSLDTQELSALMGRNNKLLRTIINLLLNENSESSGEVESVIKSISSLCSLATNRENLVKNGVIEALVRCILRDEKSEGKLATMAMDAVEVLIGGDSGKVRLLSNENGVNALVKMVFRDHEGSESAINSLIIVCSDSVKARESGICAGVLSQLLLVLQSQCNGRLKTKAKMLLKLLGSTISHVVD